MNDESKENDSSDVKMEAFAAVAASQDQLDREVIQLRATVAAQREIIRLLVRELRE